MIAIKGIEEIPTDCKECPFMGTYGTYVNPKDALNPMICVAMWAATRRTKFCTGGRVLDDCPLVKIVTCKDCKYNNTYTCDFDGYGIDDDFYCANAERKEK